MADVILEWTFDVSRYANISILRSEIIIFRGESVRNKWKTRKKHRFYPARKCFKIFQWSPLWNIFKGKIKIAHLLPKGSACRDDHFWPTWPLLGRTLDKKICLTCTLNESALFLPLSPHKTPCEEFNSPELYKKNQKQVKKIKKGRFQPFLNRHKTKLFYSNVQTRPKCYESFKTEYSDSTSFINRLTPLIYFFRGSKFFWGAKRGVPLKFLPFFCLCLTIID